MVTIKELEADLKSVTDRLDKIDQMAAGKTTMVFRCLHSRKFFPGDYLRRWSSLYGTGMGGRPRSTCLDSMYTVRPYFGRKINDVNQIMHPVKASEAQLDVEWVSPEEADSNMLIIATTRAAQRALQSIMIEKQIKNPRGQVALFRSIYERNMGSVPEEILKQIEEG